MPVAFYMDVHVPQAITDQLRRRQVDVLTSIEDGREHAEDHELMERARDLRRVVFTQDIRFHSLAQHWHGEGRQFAGLVFAHPLSATIGELVRDLELIAKASDQEEWQNVTERLPFK
jgi:hypothetical protein